MMRQSRFRSRKVDVELGDRSDMALEIVEPGDGG
jgi:hypothetical protein